MRWADLGDASHGFSLLNEAKYGYDAKDNVLRLTLLRSPTAPDPLADQGEHTFEYSFYPHALSWKQAETEHRGYEFNYKLTAAQAEAHTGPLPPAMSFVGVEPNNLVLTAVKKTEDGAGLLLRFYEWAGKSGTATLTVPGGFSSATMTNLMETPEAGSLATSGKAISVPFTPYSIVTVRVDYQRQAPDLLSETNRR